MKKIIVSLVLSMLIFPTNNAFALRKLEIPGFSPYIQALSKKITSIKNAQRYALPNNKQKNKSSSSKTSIFDIKLTHDQTNFNKINSFKLPFDPTVVNCSHPDLKAGKRDRASRIKHYFSTAKQYLAAVQNASAKQGAMLCKKGLWYAARAYCSNPSAYANELNTIVNPLRRKCLTAFKRYWVQNVYLAKGQQPPVWSINPTQIKLALVKKMRFLNMNLRRSVKYYENMIGFLEILKFAPKYRDALEGFAYSYALYFETTKEEAKRNLKQGHLGGRLSRTTKPKLYQFAIDELLGKHHRIENGQLKLGASYLDVNYLTEKVYLPELSKNTDKLKNAKCSLNLRYKRINYDAKAVAKELQKGNRGLCSKYKLKVTPADILRNPYLKFEFVKILSQKTANPSKTLENAAFSIAREIGASKIKVCWLYENPYPESIKPTFGRNAHCSNVMTKGTHNIRPGFISYIYKPAPIKKLTKLKIKDMRALLKFAGSKGKSLDRKLKRAYRKAKGIKCMAWNITIARDYLGGGRYGKYYLRSNGYPTKVSCSKIRKNSKIKKVMHGWNNYFDSVYGGKWNGHWRIITNYFRKKLRKERPAIVYVKRKI